VTPETSPRRTLRRRDGHEPPQERPFLTTARIVGAFVLLCCCWVFTNPGSAAPDEPDHLVKAIGNATGQLGHRPPELGPKATWLEERNESTTRVYDIPARLDPTGMTCFAFVPTATAACQPDRPPKDAGDVEVSSALGDYPPFLYVPIGAAALPAQTPYQAFVGGRLAVALMSMGLLWLGAAQLTRWLGRRAVLAYVVLMTPVGVFLASSVSTSGIELTASACVASVVITCALRSDALRAPSTHWTFLVGASLLALSRQFGVLELAVLALALVFLVGGRQVWELVRNRQRSLVTAMVVVGVATLAALWWERTYDRPAHVLSPLDGDAVPVFLSNGLSTITSAFGTFGWLDTTLPSLATGAWIVMWVVAIGMACLIGPSRVAVVIVGLVVGTLALAYVVYASAFFPIGAGIQGRHFMSLFAPAVMLSVVVVVVAEQRDLGPHVHRRLYVSAALVVTVVQFVAVYANARRYAVGSDGPWWWISDAEWTPSGGWPLWLVLAATAAVWLGLETLRLRPTAEDTDRPTSPEPAAAAPVVS
jgi:hypothetical protein